MNTQHAITVAFAAFMDECAPHLEPEAVALRDEVIRIMGYPVDIVLYCPKCATPHIDAKETEEAYFKRAPLPKRWMNPPHKSHLCHACAHVWRPSDTPTNGVAATVSGKDADTTPDAGPFHKAYLDVLDSGMGAVRITAVPVSELQDRTTAPPCYVDNFAASLKAAAASFSRWPDEPTPIKPAAFPWVGKERPATLDPTITTALQERNEPPTVVTLTARLAAATDKLRRIEAALDAPDSIYDTVVTVRGIIDEPAA